MSRIDDRLSERFRSASVPTATDNVTMGIGERRRRVATRRRLGTGVLAAVVAAGTLGGYAILDRAFEGRADRSATSVSTGINGPLVTVERGSDGGSQLVLYPEPGGEGRVLLRLPDRQILDLAPSPDGRSVAFGWRTPFETDSFGLSVLDISTGEERTIAAGLYRDAAWSPDGRAIVVQHATSAWEGLVVIDVASGEQLNLIEGPGADPAWSPDGVTIAFESPSDQNITTRLEDVGIYLIDASGGEPVRFAIQGASPAWSPDGTTLAYTVLRVGVWTKPVDGGEPTLIIGGTPEEASRILAFIEPRLYWSPAWSPDGRYLTYGVSYAGEPWIEANRLDGSTTWRLGLGESFAWLPEAVPPLDLGPRTDIQACRSARIDGVFSPEFDSAWILEEDSGGSSCEGGGPQYVAVGTSDGPVIMSADISDIPLGDVQRALWPFATPDIDGDGIDEIAVGIGGSRAHGWVDIKLFRFDPTARQIVEMAWEGDPQLDRSQPITVGAQAAGVFGAYCGALEGGDDTVGLVSWSAGVNTSWDEVRAFLYVPDDEGRLVFHDSGGWATSDPPASYPDDGSRSLCGSAAYWPEDLGMAVGPIDEANATNIPGVPFPVCRVSSIGGSFGDGLDTVWVLEEENRRNEGCLGEGFQRLAVGRDGRVEAYTDRLTDVVGDELWPAWTFAAPDLDGDGIDEIALGVGRWPQDADASDTAVTVSLWHVVGGQPVPIAEAGPFIRLGQHGDEHHGAVCERFGGRFGLLRWVVVDGTGELNGVLWVLEGDYLWPTDITEVRTGEASASLHDGTRELCGSPTHPANEFDV